MPDRAVRMRTPVAKAAHGRSFGGVGAVTDTWPEIPLISAPVTGEAILVALRWRTGARHLVPEIVRWNPALRRWQSGAAGIEESAIVRCWRLPKLEG